MKDRCDNCRHCNIRSDLYARRVVNDNCSQEFALTRVTDGPQVVDERTDTIFQKPAYYCRRFPTEVGVAADYGCGEWRHA